MFKTIKSIYLVGIKGVAQTGLAIIFNKMGINVTGSDIADEFITDEILNKNQIPVLQGFKEENIPEGTDLIIYSAAHGGKNNVEVKAGVDTGFKTLSQAQALGELLKNFKKTVAIAGCHGKTTTSSLLAYALIKLNQNPSYLVGTSQFNGYFGADLAQDKYFIVEADEYAVDPPADKTAKFTFLNPDYILATNIDFDHPDVYNNLKEVSETFLHFFQKLELKGGKQARLFYCIDDKNLSQVVITLPENLSLSFGYSSQADLQIKDLRSDIDKSTFRLVFKGENLGELSIGLFGEKNISNAAGVILYLIQQGFAPEKIKKAICDFSGAKRRLEKVFHLKNTYLFDDYAHHPQEILTTIDALRKRYTQKRIIGVFQPHTFSRTQVLKNQFVNALSQLDFAFILPIFASARENSDTYKINSLDLENASRSLKRGNIKAVSSNQLCTLLSKVLKHGDIVVTMGAGDVYKLKNDIINVIKIL